jgi:hypothetical protein
MITIKSFEQDGAKYISCTTYKDDKWFERAFEYTDNDKVSTIVKLIEADINWLLTK